MNTETAAAKKTVARERRAFGQRRSYGVDPIEIRDKSATREFVESETAAAVDLVLGAGVAQETGGPKGDTGALASVELESKGKSATNGVVKTEAAAFEGLVLGAEVVQEMDGP